MVKKFWAKSTGVDLIFHSRNVEKVAVCIFDKTCTEPLKRDIVSKSALLHDIGKATTHFQKLLKSNREETSLRKKNIKDSPGFRHNEIGWAFLWKYLKMGNNLTIDEKKAVIENVYWHHGISNKMGDHNSDEILNLISEEDIDNMKEVLVQLLGTEYLNTNGIGYKMEKTPNYYYTTSDSDFKAKNSQNIIYRTCLISADRIVSSMNDNITVNINMLLGDYTDRKIVHGLGDIIHQHSQRLQDQIDIADTIQASDGNTFIVKAPAGSGKTLISLLWSLRRKKKLIWVCPINSVARSVYKSILKELKDDTKVSVELYLTGEKKLCNIEGIGEFNSDIIVTNIDNYLKPTVDNGVADRLFLINECDVVFDEYHELMANKIALFAAFVNTMRSRHRFTNSTTVLLSATPTPMEFLWDFPSKKTIVLPNQTHHYPAAHTKKYLYNVESKKNIYDVRLETNIDNLLLMNAISSAQYMFFSNKGMDNKLLHSKFEQERRIELLEDLMKIYGHYNHQSLTSTATKYNFFGTLILQTSLDISFKYLYDSVLSPEATLQRIGRCNRWGEYEEGCVINTFRIDLNDAETKMISEVYSTELNKEWFKYIKTNLNGLYWTLDEIYKHYNEFNRQNKAKIRSYINTRFTKSLDALSTEYPRKYNIFPDSKNKKKVFSNHANPLRYVKIDRFLIFPKYNAIGEITGFTEPFTESVYNDDFMSKYHEKSKDLFREIKKCLLLLKKDDRYGYEKRYKKVISKISAYNLSRLQERHSNMSDTPYIVLDKEHHPQYGIIKRTDLKRYLDGGRDSFDGFELTDFELELI